MSKHHYFTSCAECEKPETNSKGFCRKCAQLPQYADDRLVDDVGLAIQQALSEGAGR